MINLQEVETRITEAMKAKDPIKRETYRLIKSKFIEAATKQGSSGILSEADRKVIITKLAKELNADVCMYGDSALGKESAAQLEIVNTLLPPAVSADVIAQFIDATFPDGCSKKTMGVVIKTTKQEFPDADTEVIVTLVRNRLHD